MTEDIDFNLPFFSYGFFRPGEISFLGIKEFVDSASKFVIDGDLTLRDGVTLFKDSNTITVEGYLIHFNSNDSRQAYDYINSLEPKKLFKWKVKSFNGQDFNILYGVKPDRGSDDIRESNWSTIWEDPFFNSAIDVLDEMPSDSFEWDLKPLFKLQMKYMLLWTIIERFTFLRYSIGGGPNARNKLFSQNEYFIEGLKKFVDSTEVRTVFSSEDPDDKTILKNSNPIKSLMYYYQVRCNITHRGKAIIRDHDTVEKSFIELFNITKYVLSKTKEECEMVKKEIENCNF